MRQTAPHRPASAAILRRVGLVWLVLALVWAPALGLMHRQVHGTAGLAQIRAAGLPAAATSTTSTALADGLASLFIGHGSLADCQLYDQCSTADTLPGVPALALAPVLPALVLPVVAGRVPPGRAVPYHARGPPVFH
jgi:hypothetical protein